MTTAAYDPEARHDTPLALKLKARIRRDGPIPVHEYVRSCLQDPEHGYYRSRPAIGAAGDFITAPEISQAFGELIGLWSAVVWQQMGSPQRLHLVEAGPGRGTLMADALRATARVAGFHAAADVVFVESNATLRAAQAVAMRSSGVAARWCEAFPTLAHPAIVIANEFLDAEPVVQRIKTAEGWRLRSVGLDDLGRLQFASMAAGGEETVIEARRPAAPVGSIDEESRSQLLAWLQVQLQDRGRGAPLIAALCIDYGTSEPRLGDTLQAVLGHAFEHPLANPGLADLSTAVDFHGAVRQMHDAGFAVGGPVTQAEFLGRLGMLERASRLMAANPDKAATIEAGVARLLSPSGMGTRFKVLGVRSTVLPPLPGLTEVDTRPRTP